MTERPRPDGEVGGGDAAPTKDDEVAPPAPRPRGLGLPGRILHGNWLVGMMIAGAILSVVVGMCRE